MRFSTGARMSPLTGWLCLLNRHEPDRPKVDWDGTHYVGTCTRCGIPIRRKRKHRWLRDWTQP